MSREAYGTLDRTQIHKTPGFDFQLSYQVWEILHPSPLLSPDLDLHLESREIADG